MVTDLIAATQTKTKRMPQQARYQPTYLNDRAIAVQLTVTVTFKLDR